MKFFWRLVLVSLAATAFAEEINYKKLSDRFVTSVKEAQIDNQFLGLPQVQECVQKNPLPKDLNDANKVREAQQAAAGCMRDKFKDVDEKDLTKLSEKLQLDAFGVVKGKSNAALVDYLSSRLEKALYGHEGGKIKRLGEQKIVDQKVFVDLYETQLGKNILLEISNYCYGRLNVNDSTSTNRLKKIVELSDIKKEIEASRIDDSVNIIPEIGDEAQVYDHVAKQLENFTGSNPELAPSMLGQLFIKCATIIPQMCEYYEDCLCQYKQGRPEFAGTPACNPKTAVRCATKPNEPPKIGQHSCHVAARLRGYRTNLTAVNETQDKFDTQYQGGEDLLRKEVYSKKGSGRGTSVDDLTSMTTGEAEEIFKNQKLTEESEKIPDECESNPENTDCEKYFYNESEVRRFAQSSAGFTAATLVESAKIDKLPTNDLKKYLTDRGYLDLVKQLDEGANAKEVVASARSRFEAEREATYNEMTSAFERKQLTTDEKNPNAKKIEDAKRELRNKSKDFQQLILFNNVVSSYLEVQRKKEDNTLESAGRNTKAFEREMDDAKKPSASSASTKYFENLQNAGEASQIQDGDTPLVDISFLDQILGKPSDATPDAPAD